MRATIEVLYVKRMTLRVLNLRESCNMEIL